MHIISFLSLNLSKPIFHVHYTHSPHSRMAMHGRHLSYPPLQARSVNWINGCIGVSPLSSLVSETRSNLSTDLHGHQAYRCGQQCSTLAADSLPYHEAVPHQRAGSLPPSSPQSQSEGSSPSPNLRTESMPTHWCHRGCPRPVRLLASAARAGTHECTWVADLERGWWDGGLRWRRRWSWRWTQWHRGFWWWYQGRGWRGGLCGSLEFLGLLLALNLGLSWSPCPSYDGDGALGLSWSPGPSSWWRVWAWVGAQPKMLMKGPMPPMLATLIGPCPHQFSPLG